MGLQAASYQAAFDYDNAVKTYLALYDTAARQAARHQGAEPLPGEKPQTLDQIGLDAVYNAALASELGRDFKKAIELYTSTARSSRSPQEGPRAVVDRGDLSPAGRHHRDDRELRPLARTLRPRIRQRGRLRRDVLRHAAANKKKGRAPAAKAAGQATIDAWKGRGSIKNSGAPRWPASGSCSSPRTSTRRPGALPAQDRRPEPRRGQGPGRPARSLKTQVEDKYLALDPYGVVEYSMAAKVRLRDVQYGAAQKIADAPIPVRWRGATTTR